MTLSHEQAEAIARWQRRQLEARAETRRAVRIAVAALALIALAGGGLAWWALGRML